MRRSHEFRLHIVVSMNIVSCEVLTLYFAFQCPSHPSLADFESILIEWNHV